MKIRRIRIPVVLAAFVVVVLAGIAVVSLILQPTPPAFRVGSALKRGDIIFAQARAGDFGVRLGDAFPFLLQVQYDTAQVAGIDRASLDRAVSFKPFEIRGYKETEFDLDSHTHLYQREYSLQLIDGQVGKTFSFPTIVVRYQLRNANGFAEKAVVPDPIFVGARLPENVDDLELRLITAFVVDPSRERLIWAVWALGGFLLVAGAADLTLRALPAWRKQAMQRRRMRSGDVFVQAYRSLCQRAAAPGDPKSLLHQTAHVLRLVLAQQEKVGLLEEPDLEKLPSAIRSTVTALFDECQQAYRADGIQAVSVEQAMKQLEAILQFYFGEREVEAWRD